MKTITLDKEIKLVAKEFIQGIRESLTTKEIKEVIKKNETPEYKGCCATHDYLDAKMVMEKALEKAGVKSFTEEVPETEAWDESIGIVNRAWDLAKEVKFNGMKIDA